jgi:hypothetical protein
LFYKSRWTQEELAVKEGKSQSWVARQLLFGRFLTNMPNGITVESALSEGQFRKAWEKTNKNEPNERVRFRQALEFMADIVLHGSFSSCVILRNCSRQSHRYLTVL